MVTYLLGAGASCQAMPIIKDIETSIEKTISIISRNEYDLSSFKESQYFRGLNPELIKEGLINDFNWLMKSIKDHASVDTFAKKLMLSGKYSDLKYMKNTLSSFLSLSELINGVDKRYDSLLASLCKNDLRIPNNVNVLSWNYDTQLERCFSHYTDVKEYQKNSLLLEIHTKGCNYFKPSECKVIKLNGSALLKRKGTVDLEPFVNNLHVQFDQNSFAEFILKYHFLILNQSYDAGISYAWEDDSALLGLLSKHVENTEVLVIIGYSFPFFNREIDRHIINCMSKLKKIYYQTPEKTDIAENRILAVIEPLQKKINPFIYSDCSQFFIPPEL